MKIVCDACAAKYSIADDKVKGKVFKIRCKKCSNIIVVRGTAGADEPVAAAPYDQKETRVYDYGSQDGGAAPPADDAVWHVVIDQEQVGPITVADVSARFAAGELDAESYIWREGFADWLPLSQVPEFASLAASGATSASQPPEPSASQDAVASMFGSTAYEEPAPPPQAGGDVFAAHAAKAAAVADDGGDLFGDVAPPAPEAAPFGGARAAAPAPGAAGAGMKGQRSENSVLFSLNNLAAMASDKPAAAASSSSGAAQHGGGEGSGLIDIRSMASSYLGGKGAAPARPGPSVGSVDDIPVFATSTFAEPAVIMPVSGGARNNNTLYILLGAVGLLAAAAVVLVVVLMSRKDNKPAQVAATTTTTTPAAGSTTGSAGSGAGSELVATGPTTPAGGTDPAGIGAGSATPPSGSAEGSAAGSAAVVPPPSGSAAGSAATPPVTPAKPEHTTTPEKPARTTERERERERVASTPAKPERTTTPAIVPDKPAKPEKPSAGGCIDEVACLLADPKPACCLKKTTTRTTTTTTTTKPPVDTNLQESLSKTDIAAGIDKVKPKALACASKSPAKGTVKVSVKVSGAGTVSAVTVKESPDGALGSCVAAAVQKATFAKSQEGATFSYPFKF